MSLGREIHCDFLPPVFGLSNVGVDQRLASKTKPQEENTARPGKFLGAPEVRKCSSIAGMPDSAESYFFKLNGIGIP
jgi:hypothetical protein